jgi:two-component system, NarL family, nitrate/nitrite response regulator NarL
VITEVTEIREVNLTNGNSNGLYGKAETVHTVSVCDTQPVTMEGVRWILNTQSDLKFLTGTETLDRAMQLAHQAEPDILLLDKAFGIQAILDWLNAPADAPEVPHGSPNTAIIVWGVSVSEAEALRFLQAGARGILRKNANLAAILACIRTVAAGRSWMEDCVFRESARADRYPRSELTPREQQVLDLVEQGCKNKEIAQELGIRPGTVKIHLKHIFEKTGIRGRYGLALNGWRDRSPE